ncbi:hypothetical protein ACOME3_004606 [Neoechinorhynchus agilis]
MRRSSTLHRTSTTKIGSQLFASKRAFSPLDEENRCKQSCPVSLEDRIKNLKREFNESDLIELMKAVSIDLDEDLCFSIESIAVEKSDRKRELADDSSCWPLLRAKLLASVIDPSVRLSDIDLVSPDVLIENQELVKHPLMIESLLAKWTSQDDLFVLFGICARHRVYPSSIWSEIQRQEGDEAVEALILFTLNHDPEFGAAILKKSIKCGCDNEREFAFTLSALGNLTSFRNIVSRKLESFNITSAPLWIKEILKRDYAEIDVKNCVRLAAKLLPVRLTAKNVSQCYWARISQNNSFFLDSIEYSNLFFPSIYVPDVHCTTDFLMDLLDAGNVNHVALFEFIHASLMAIESYRDQNSIGSFLCHLVNRCQSPAPMELICYLFKKCPLILNPHVDSIFCVRFEELTINVPIEQPKFICALEHMMANSSVMRKVVFDSIKTSLFESDRRPFATSALLCLLRHVKLLASSVIPSSYASQIVSISSQYTSQSNCNVALCLSAIDSLRRSLKAGGLSDPKTMLYVSEYLPRVHKQNSYLANALYSLLADLLEQIEDDGHCYALLVKTAASCIETVSNSDCSYKRLCAILKDIEQKAFADDRTFKSLCDSLIDVTLKQGRSINALVHKRDFLLNEQPELSSESLEISLNLLISENSHLS